MLHLYFVISYTVTSYRQQTE